MAVLVFEAPLHPLQPSCKPAISHMPQFPIRIIVFVLERRRRVSCFPVRQRPLLDVLTPSRRIFVRKIGSAPRVKRRSCSSTGRRSAASVMSA